MKQISPIALLIAGLLLILLAGCGKGSIDEGTVVSVIYSTDSHGKLEGCGCKKNGGGITKRAAKIEAARAQDATVLYLDAGNFLSGTPEVDKSNGDIIVEVYSQLGVSAVNVSERELSFGVETFRKAKEASKFPYISANLRYEGNSLAEPYVIQKIKGANVAVVGLCGTREVMRYDSSKLPTGVAIEDPLVTARRVIPVLNGKADIIILLSTCGDAMDSLLAQNLQMVTLIIGGRSYRPNSDSPWLIGNVRLLRAERDGRTLGRMDMVFGTDRKLKTFSPSTLALETSDPSSESIASLVRKYIPSFTDNPTEGVRIKD